MTFLLPNEQCQSVNKTSTKVTRDRIYRKKCTAESEQYAHIQDTHTTIKSVLRKQKQDHYE